MHNNNKARLGIVAAAAVALLAFGTAAPAMADPSGYRDLNGVGSDTSQDVLNGLAAVIPALGSYDATGSSLIQTTSAGTPFARPNGSSAGQQALSRAISGTTWGTPGVSVTGQIDFARSSSAPSSSFGTGGELTFIPFARDAVTYAVSAASDFPRDVPLGTAAQDSAPLAPFTLRNIYRSVVTSYVDADFESVTINPLIPQGGSGTRSFWITNALGLTEESLGGTVSATNNGVSVQEHDGTTIVGPGDIVPFSIGQYIAQGNHGALPTAVPERRGNIELGRIGSVKPYVFSSGGGIELNSSFPVTRLIFNVVSTPRLSGVSAADVALQSTFVGTGSAVCQAQSTIRDYGFGTIGALCGNTTTYKQGLRP